MVEESYQSHIPPSSIDTASFNKSIITLGVDIINILDVSEVDSYLEVQFRLEIIWRDPRLSFWNLKEGSLINIASDVEAGEIWHPPVIFKNTKEKLMTKESIFHLYSILCNV